MTDPRHARRVAMLSYHTNPLAALGGKKTGGMNVYVRELSRALARHDWLVDVFTRADDPDGPRVATELGPGVRVMALPAGPVGPLPVAAMADYVADFAREVAAFAADDGVVYDVVHSNYWLAGLVAGALREAWPHAPIVHMFHTLGHMKDRIAPVTDPTASAARVVGETAVLDIADRIIVATPAERAQLHWLYGADIAKTVVVPPGVNLTRFQPIPRDDAARRVGIDVGHKNIIYAGRIEPLKGIDTLLEAIALIKRQHEDLVQQVCVCIIGGDPWTPDPDVEMARLQEMRAALDLEHLVTFLGAKNQDLLPNYFAAAEMVVMPSHYESFGMVALEAMAMGTPVIASEVGGLAYLVRDAETGFHVPCRDPEALAERIYLLLSDRSTRDQLGAQARAYAQRFSWDRVAPRIVEVYQALLAAEDVD